MSTSSRIAPWASPTAQRRLAALEHQHTESSSGALTDSIRRAIAAHHQAVCDGVMLYAGTNVLSPAVAALHDSALSTRPALGWPGEKVQTAVDQIEHLEVIANRQVAASLHAAFAEVRFLTATMANLAVYTAFTGPGDTIAVLSPEAGGHASHQEHLGTAGVRGVNVQHLPYSVGTLDVHAGEIDGFVSRTQPRLIMVGGSVTLFPHHLAPLREAADRVGALIVYDASHTAGLMAAGHFQDPLAEGADIVTFSTYKTYAGPAGGAAVTNSAEYAERLADAAYPTLLSNYDPSRLGPLAMAAREAIEQSPRWATMTIEYARELAAHLNAMGLVVVGRRQGYTRTHQIVIDAQPLGGGPAAVARLRDDGIYTGACRLPWQNPGSPPQGIRLGVQEFIRRGAGFDTITDLADLLYRSLTGTAGQPVAEVARQLRQRITTDLWGRPTPAASTEQCSTV